MMTRHGITSGQPIKIIVGLLLIFISLSSCTNAAEETAAQPTPTPASNQVTIPAEVHLARDSVLTYLNTHYGNPLPPPASVWESNVLVPDSGIDLNTYHFAADECVVVVSCPNLLADPATYHVVLDDRNSGIHWEADVAADGHLLLPSIMESFNTQPTGKTINIVAGAGLTDTTRIEIYEMGCACYTAVATIDDPALIQELVQALDAEMPLKSRSRFPALFRISFVQADGRHLDFGYSFEVMAPAFMQGGQAFWQGDDGLTPAPFNELMKELLAPGSQEPAT